MMADDEKSPDVINEIQVIVQGTPVDYREVPHLPPVIKSPPPGPWPKKQKRMRGSVRPLLQCPDCPKKFSHVGYMRMHRVTHSEENRPYGCHLCGQRFNQRGHRQLHMRSHTAENSRKQYGKKNIVKYAQQYQSLSQSLPVIKGNEISDEHPCQFDWMDCEELLQPLTSLCVPLQDNKENSPTNWSGARGDGLAAQHFEKQVPGPSWVQNPVPTDDFYRVTTNNIPLIRNYNCTSNGNLMVGRYERAFGKQMVNVLPMVQILPNYETTINLPNERRNRNKAIVLVDGLATEYFGNQVIHRLSIQQGLPNHEPIIDSPHESRNNGHTNTIYKLFDNSTIKQLEHQIVNRVPVTTKLPIYEATVDFSKHDKSDSCLHKCNTLSDSSAIEICQSKQEILNTYFYSPNHNSFAKSVKNRDHYGYWLLELNRFSELEEVQSRQLDDGTSVSLVDCKNSELNPYVFIEKNTEEESSNDLLRMKCGNDQMSSCFKNQD